jgi:hypothetical protein
MTELVASGRPDGVGHRWMGRTTKLRRENGVGHGRWTGSKKIEKRNFAYLLLAKTCPCIATGEKTIIFMKMTTKRYTRTCTHTII